MVCHYNTLIIPLPLFGATSWPDISQISRSESMRPWSIRQSYDRPIPRRIAEDAGIARNEYGLEKHGAGVSFHFDSFGRMLKKMSPTSLKDLKKYKLEGHYSKIAFLYQAVRFYRAELPIYANYLLSRLNMPWRLKHHKKHYSSPYSMLLIRWGIDRMRKNYKIE